MHKYLTSVFVMILLSSGLLSAGIAHTHPVAEQLFIYMEPTVDTTSIQYIRTFQADGKSRDDISNLFQLIRKSATSAGANCFKLRSFIRDEKTGAMSLRLAAFRAEQIHLHLILNHQPRNTVFIFSDLLFNSGNQVIKINGKKITLNSASYYKLTLKEGEEIAISKGGALGARTHITGKGDSMPVCYSVSGFSISQAAYPSYYVMFGLMGALAEFSTGSVIPVEPDFGMLLKEILPAHKG